MRAGRDPHPELVGVDVVGEGVQSIVVEQRWAGCLSRTESLQEFGGDLERGSPQANKLQSMVFGSSYSGCRIFALVVLVSMARTSGAWSASRYVARGGSDESACSASTRCASLSRAADELVPGDTLCVLHSGTAEACSASSSTPGAASRIATKD